MILFACGVGFGIAAAAIAIYLIILALARKGVSIVTGKTKLLSWNLEDIDA